MNCFAIKEKLENYLDGALSDDESKIIARHLTHCPNCTGELEALQKLNSLMRMDLYEEPPQQYWTTLPRAITSRLGLVPEPSLYRRALNALDAIAIAPSFKWGMATAAVAVVAVVLFRAVYTPAPDSISLAQQEESLTVSPNFTLTAESEVALVAAPTRRDGKAQSEQLTPNDSKGVVLQEIETNVIAKSAQPNVASDSDTPVPSPQKSVLVQLDLVKSVPSRRIETAEPIIDQMIYPVPFGTQVLLSDTIDNRELESGDVIPLWGSYSLSQTLGPSPVPLQETAAEQASEEENDYSETLWFVKKSKSLEEKRNIWLSYINREEDPTYRWLGIYGMAMVLSQMVEKAGDPARALEALEFYSENQITLHAFMSATKYDAAVEIFQDILTK